MIISTLQNKFYYFLKSEINEIYLTHSIRSFITSMIAVFIPIFLVEKGFSLYEVGLYYLIQAFGVLLFVNQFIKFAARKGFKRSIVLSMPLLLIFFLSLRYFDFLSNILTPLGALITISAYAVIPGMYYWMGFHLDFAQVHAKIVVVDSTVAIVSSMNFFSASSGGSSWEAGIVSTDEKVVKNIKKSILDILIRPETTKA